MEKRFRKRVFEWWEKMNSRIDNDMMFEEKGTEKFLWY
jgi:hypothetical protein